jgi:hypothetical protein
VATGELQERMVFLHSLVYTQVVKGASLSFRDHGHTGLKPCVCSLLGVIALTLSLLAPAMPTRCAQMVMALWERGLQCALTVC